MLCGCGAATGIGYHCHPVWFNECQWHLIHHTAIVDTVQSNFLHLQYQADTHPSNSVMFIILYHNVVLRSIRNTTYFSWIKTYGIIVVQLYIAVLNFLGFIRFHYKYYASRHAASNMFMLAVWYSVCLGETCCIVIYTLMYWRPLIVLWTSGY